MKKKPIPVCMLLILIISMSVAIINTKSRPANPEPPESTPEYTIPNIKLYATNQDMYKDIAKGTARPLCIVGGTYFILRLAIYLIFDQNNDDSQDPNEHNSGKS